MISHQLDRLWKQLIVLFLDESMKAFTGRITYTGKTFVQSKPRERLLLSCRTLYIAGK